MLTCSIRFWNYCESLLNGRWSYETASGKAIGTFDFNNDHLTSSSSFINEGNSGFKGSYYVKDRQLLLIVPEILMRNHSPFKITFDLTLVNNDTVLASTDNSNLSPVHVFKISPFPNPYHDEKIIEGTDEREVEFNRIN